MGGDYKGWQSKKNGAEVQVQIPSGPAEHAARLRKQEIAFRTTL